MNSDMVYLGSLLGLWLCYIAFSTPRLSGLLPQVRIGNLDFGRFWGLLLVWQVAMSVILSFDDLVGISRRMPWLGTTRPSRSMRVFDWTVIVLAILFVILSAWNSHLYDAMFFVAVAAALTGTISIVRQEIREEGRDEIA